MKLEKERQLIWLKHELAVKVENKFRKGDREHRDDLMDLDLVNEALDEVIDAVVYLMLAVKKTKKK